MVTHSNNDLKLIMASLKCSDNEKASDEGRDGIQFGTHSNELQTKTAAFSNAPAVYQGFTSNDNIFVSIFFRARTNAIDVVYDFNNGYRNRTVFDRSFEL